MEYAADRWVRRLRDGVVPKPWPVLVGAALLTIGAAVALVAEFSGPGFFDHVTGSRAQSSVVLFPAFLVVLGVGIVIGTGWSGRRDRRTLARVRDSGRTPAFFLPVCAKTPCSISRGRTTGGSTSPRRTPAACGSTTLSGSTWPTVARSSSHRERRSAVFEAGQTKLDILMRVLRSLRRELER